MARFARLTLVGKSAGHQLVSLADSPTIVIWLVGQLVSLADSPTSQLVSWPAGFAGRLTE